MCHTVDMHCPPVCMLISVDVVAPGRWLAVHVSCPEQLCGQPGCLRGAGQHFCSQADQERGMRAGMPGMPQMSEQELMKETIQTAGSSVSRGKVRRKKGVRKGKSGRGGLAELVSMR